MKKSYWANVVALLAGDDSDEWGEQYRADLDALNARAWGVDKNGDEIAINEIEAMCDLTGRRWFCVCVDDQECDVLCRAEDFEDEDRAEVEAMNAGDVERIGAWLVTRIA